MAKQIALLLLLAGLAAATASSGASGDVDQLGVPDPADPEDMYYFWNEVTGQVQWEDPGTYHAEATSCCRCMGMIVWV
jgi:hypothetical protein